MTAARAHAQRFGGLELHAVPAMLIHYENDRLSSQPRPIEVAGQRFQFFGVCPPVAQIGGAA